MNITEQGPKLRNEDIYSFEVDNDVSLPKDYHAFLSKYNGGIPYPNAFVALSGAQVAVSRFFSLKAVNLFDDLAFKCWSHAWAHAKKQGVLQIGYDIGGQEIMLHTRGENQGRIYLVIDNDAHLCANSFEDFMTKLDKRDGIVLDESSALMDRIFNP